MAYIYLHRRNDTGEVFYVGKGSGKRAWTTNGRNDHWNKVVNKAGYTVEIIAKGLTDEEAYWIEPLLIEAHGGVDKLTNMVEGGEGWTSEDARKIAKERWKDPEFREKHSQILKEAYKDPELREKMSQIQKEVWKDPELREKLSQIGKEVYKDPELREKVSQIQKEVWKDPELREKMSQSSKRRVECDRCGRSIGICVLKQHQRGPYCYNSVTKTP